METSKILAIMFLIGVVLFMVSNFQVLKSKGKIKKSTLALVLATIIIILPWETFNLITESTIGLKISFIMTLLFGLISVLYLASDTKEK